MSAGYTDLPSDGGMDPRNAPAVDPDSDSARLARHRAHHSMWPNDRPETHAERRLREALDHLDRVLNGCRSAAEQQEADTKAREFLADCGR